MNMQHQFQQSLFMNPCVLQFINRTVDTPAACRSWYAPCTLCSRPCSGYGCFRACCCAATGALVGARRKLWSSAVAVSLGSRNACFDYGYIFCIIQGGFWKNFCNFPRDWVDSDPEVNSCRSLHTWPMRKWPCSSSTVAVACVCWFCLWCTSRCVPDDCRQSAELCTVHFSSALELHLEICTLFLRAPLYFQHFPQSNFGASRFFGALEHSQL